MQGTLNPCKKRKTKEALSLWLLDLFWYVDDCILCISPVTKRCETEESSACLSLSLRSVLLWWSAFDLLAIPWERWWMPMTVCVEVLTLMQTIECGSVWSVVVIFWPVYDCGEGLFLGAKCGTKSLDSFSILVHRCFYPGLWWELSALGIFLVSYLTNIDFCTWGICLCRLRHFHSSSRR